MPTASVRGRGRACRDVPEVVRRELAEDDKLRPVADPVFGPRVQREFRNMTRKLRRSLRSTVERGTMVEWIGIEAFMESVEVMLIVVVSVPLYAVDSTCVT